VAKYTIKEIAAVAEVMATVAVLTTLGILIFSINQNTKALQSINDNFLYQLQDSRLSDLNSSPDLARIVSRFDSGEELADHEARKYAAWVVRKLNMWELAYSRHRNGLMPPEQWVAWDGALSTNIPYEFPEDWWILMRYEYGEQFAAHVDAAYARNRKTNSD